MIVHCSHTSLKDIDTLTEHPRNPNKHPDKQIKLLAKIMKHQGWRHPVTISKRSGFVVAGHGRIESARLNGWTQVPVDEQEFENEADEYAHLIADNKIQELAEPDEDLIQEIALDLGPDFDFDLFGIEDFEVKGVDTLPPGAEDIVPQTPVEATAKLGQIYKLGNHRLMCGDATKDIDELLGGAKIDMVYTDPPYGMNLDVNYGDIIKERKHYSGMSANHEYEKVKGDNERYDPSPLFLTGAKEVLAWGADYFYSRLPDGGSWIAWDKRNENLDKVVGNTTEFLWSKNPHRRMTARVLWSGHHGMGKDDEKKRCHPTQKPIALHEWVFNKIKGQSVLDIYGGSGSTLIACEKTNRTCYMMELEPKYIEVIIKRWETYTGKKSELIKDV